LLYLKTTNHRPLLISIIIPVLNEERQVAKALAALESEMKSHNIEVILADGGSRDWTVEIARQFNSVRLIECDRANRGLQMNTGASVARGNVLLFLHADVRLPQGAFEAIDQALHEENVVGGCFQIRFPENRPVSLRIMETGINIRTRLFRTATGDQAIFVWRRVFEEIGGYQNVPLMEDVALFKEIKKYGRVEVLDKQVEISPRRWLKHGIWRTMLLMYALRLGYWVGISPVTLKRFFVDVR
jgi:rSAM/selenodomain-associated transferase 2